MSRSARTVLGVAAVATVATGLLVARVVTDESSRESARTTVATDVAGGDGAGSVIAVTPPQQPVTPTITIRDGTPVGGVMDLRYRTGGTIRFRVRSDAQGELFIDGYDVSRPVSPDWIETVIVPATIEGNFDIELGQRRVPLARVQVRP
jgi:hypothetical protein